MWIAKPLEALTPDEKKMWIQSCLRRAEHGEDVPLSQTLTWAGAMHAMGVRPYLVFNPGEASGGVVFTTAEDGASFECVNGPLLDWALLESEDTSAHQHLTGQFATFAMGVSKLSRQFAELQVSPRLPALKAEAWLSQLPLEPSSRSRAATLHIPIVESSETQLRAFHPRLRRTLRHSERESLAIQWKRFEAEDCARFQYRLSKFSKEKGFPCPPLSWFEALIREPSLMEEERISFWLAHAVVSDDPETSFASEAETAEAELLICFQGSQAHYLFGLERRGSEVPASLSPAALAHSRTIDEARAAGIKVYDLNGYVADAPEDHPYAGVCRFKEQFQGTLVEYEVPLFVIS